MYKGGLEELTPKSVVRNVILPLYVITEKDDKEKEEHILRTGGKS
jgi:hypothetical protein